MIGKSQIDITVIDILSTSLDVFVSGDECLPGCPLFLLQYATVCGYTCLLRFAFLRGKGFTTACSEEAKIRKIMTAVQYKCNSYVMIKTEFHHLNN
jgi:hypothetical protein